MQTTKSKSLPSTITCECGEIMTRTNIDDLFGSCVNCDGCQKRLKKTSSAYQCRMGHCFCIKCSKKLLLNINNKELVNPIHCACDEIMQLSQPNIVYDSGTAHCNNTTCRNKIDKNEYCYTCPKGKTSVHPKGYDYCMKCAKQKSMFGYVIKKSKKLKKKKYKNSFPKLHIEPSKSLQYPLIMSSDKVSTIDATQYIKATKHINDDEQQNIQSLNVNPMPHLQTKLIKKYILF